VKNKFVLYISYFFYLIILGQGCSGISNKPHFLSFKIPTLKTPKLQSYRNLKLVNTNKKIPRKELYRKAINRNSNKQLAVTKIEKKNEIKNLKNTNEEIKSFGFETSQKLSLDMHIKHNGFKLEKREQQKIATLYNDYIDNLSNRLAEIEKTAKNLNVKRNIQSEKERLAAVEDFDQKKLDDIVKVAKSSVAKNDDEMVFLDYSKNKEKEVTINVVDNKKEESIKMANAEIIESSIEEVAEQEISNRVDDVIKREMASQVALDQTAASSYTDLLKKMNKELPVNLGMAAPSRDESHESKLNIHALHAEINKEMGMNIHNFSMYSAADNNEVFEDLNEGKIEYGYSLNGYSGLLRGTIVKNFYMRTTVEIPLTGEYSNVEVPLIDIKSLEKFLDENELSGYGGYYLVDLGDQFEDVEISNDKNKENSYEYRAYLDENFKIVKSNKDFRYILFLGVIPGNIRVQYLGANRNETSKLTFVAPDEITFDIADAVPAHDLEFELMLKNTLGVQNVPLDINTNKMMTFVGNHHPNKISSNKYSLNIPWSLKGNRTYIEVNHLSSSIFVGIDDSKKLELPSTEFVQEILRSLNLEELNNRECLVQLNFANKEVVDVKVRGESALGPMTYEHSYLDKDGVFTRFLSPMTRKLFILGNEEGILPIQVEYSDGKKDYLRTYCSPGTYLLEQL